MLLLEVKINHLYFAPSVFPYLILKSKNRKLKITTIKDILILFTLLVSLVPKTLLLEQKLIAKILNSKSIAIYYP